MIIKNSVKIIAIATGFALLFPFFANAANLMVFPTRVEIAGRERSKEVKLINKGKTKTTYRITLQHLKMNENGSYEEILPGQGAGNEKFVDGIVRFSPRQVTIEPGASQTIRIMLRKPKNLADGEYRSHMLFREEAPADFGTSVEKSKSNRKISITLKPLFGVSIPIIVRHGKIESSTEITDLSLNKNVAVAGENIRTGDFLSFSIKRSGNASAHGNFIATFTPKGSSKEYEIANLNGVSVFYPYPSRKLELKIKYPEGFNSSSPGKIKVSYHPKSGDSTDKSRLLSRAVINN